MITAAGARRIGMAGCGWAERSIAAPLRRERSASRARRPTTTTTQQEATQRDLAKLGPAPPGPWLSADNRHYVK